MVLLYLLEAGMRLYEFGLRFIITTILLNLLEYFLYVIHGFIIPNVCMMHSIVVHSIACSVMQNIICNI